MAVRVPRQDRGETTPGRAGGGGGHRRRSDHGPAGVLGESRCDARRNCRLARSATTSRCWTTCSARRWPPCCAGWLDHGESVAAAGHGRGIAHAATAITAAVLPAGAPDTIRNRYEHLLAAVAQSGRGGGDGRRCGRNWRR